jgi:hypothetical protein
LITKVRVVTRRRILRDHETSVLGTGLKVDPVTPDREGLLMSWSRVLPAVVGLCVLAACTSSSPSTRPPQESTTPTGAVTATSDPALADFYQQKLDWQGCHDGFECAKVRVPVDYAAPGGTAIDLSVVRLPSHGGDRLGSLVINPGGPGASGIGYALDANSAISSTVRKHYDIVGFDPRGVGASAPIRCLTDPETDRFAAQDGSPDNSAEEAHS